MTGQDTKKIDKVTPSQTEKTGNVLPALSFSPTDIENSRMLDSTSMAAEHAVDKLTKKPDGTTLVRYYFSNSDAEADKLCSNGSELSAHCKAFIGEELQDLARQTMKSIVDESGAKIAFEETSDIKKSDVVFAKLAEKIKTERGDVIDASGTTDGKSYVAYSPDNLKLQEYRQGFEQLMAKHTPVEREAIKQKLAKIYGTDADFPAIIYSETQKRLMAHEIEHNLGAKHPQVLFSDEANSKQVTLETDPKTFFQSIMGLYVAPAGKTLGYLDIVWYQRHFGARDLPEGTLPAPLPAAVPGAEIKKER